MRAVAAQRHVSGAHTLLRQAENRQRAIQAAVKDLHSGRRKDRFFHIKSLDEPAIKEGYDPEEAL